jgi:two-component system, response regulator PdtaR
VLLEKKIKVLIVEDDFLVIEEISRSLSGLGYENVGQAATGEQAVELCESLKPDVVLMDINMPKMDGLKASEMILDNCPTPIVILTALESMDMLEKAKEVGVGAYLTKPPNGLDLCRAISIAMARHDDLMESRKLVLQLESAMAEISTLKGILPICANCKDIRDDEGFWHQVEAYVRDHSDAEFSHSICPKCIEKLYPDL